MISPLRYRKRSNRLRGQVDIEFIVIRNPGRAWTATEVRRTNPHSALCPAEDLLRQRGCAVNGTGRCRGHNCVHPDERERCRFAQGLLNADDRACEVPARRTQGRDQRRPGVRAPTPGAAIGQRDECGPARDRVRASASGAGRHRRRSASLAAWDMIAWRRQPGAPVAFAAAIAPGTCVSDRHAGQARRGRHGARNRGLETAPRGPDCFQTWPASEAARLSAGQDARRPAFGKWRGVKGVGSISCSSGAGARPHLPFQPILPVM